jgi:hypothetical protein
MPTLKVGDEARSKLAPDSLQRRETLRFVHLVPSRSDHFDSFFPLLSEIACHFLPFLELAF